MTDDSLEAAGPVPPSPQQHWRKLIATADYDYAVSLRQEFEAFGRAESLLELLAARGIDTTVEQRERIRSCKDIARLRAWLLQALASESAAELFADQAAA